MKQLVNSRVFWFFILWLVFNVIQAAFLPLDPDEAYYWEYAKALDWGYFDHPPMIALLIYVGQLFFGGSLGVRLGVVMLHLGTLIVLWKMVGAPTDARRAVLWMALVVAMPFLHIYGFVATPDSPLIFFTALYLYIFDQFAKKPSWRSAVLLGVVMAALIYSKYHGVLVIGFTVLAHLNLFRRLEFWVAGILGVVLFLPHLHWQYVHDFPSFRYHLKGRDDPYEVKFTFEYLLNQVLIFSPLLFPLLIRAISLAKLRSAYSFMVLGFWAFFLWSTSKGHVEPQWTAVLSVPLVVMAFASSEGRERYSKLMVVLGWISGGLLIALRIGLFFVPDTIKIPFKEKRWPAELAEYAQGRPVIFQNSYRDVSEYDFYTGTSSHTFTDVYYRPNQFDLWDREIQLHNQRALLVLQMDTLRYPGADTLEMTKKMKRVLWADSLQIVQKIQVVGDAYPKQMDAEQPYSVRLKVYNPYPFVVRLQTGNLPVRAQLVFLQEGQVIRRTPIEWGDTVAHWPSKSETRMKGNFVVPNLEPGDYDMVFGLSNGFLPPGWNSKAVPIRIH